MGVCLKNLFKITESKFTVIPLPNCMLPNDKKGIRSAISQSVCSFLLASPLGLQHYSTWTDIYLVFSLHLNSQNRKVFEITCHSLCKASKNPFSVKTMFSTQFSSIYTWDRHMTVFLCQIHYVIISLPSSNSMRWFLKIELELMKT